MKASLYFVGIVLILFFGCGDAEQNENVEEVVAKTSTTITNEDIESIEYAEYILSQDGQENVEDWLEYAELVNGIELTKKRDFSFFETDEETMNVFLMDLKENLPSTLNKMPVKARLLALETALLKTQEIFTINGATKPEKINALKLLYVSLSNLNLQINKKLEMDEIRAIQY